MRKLGKMGFWFWTGPSRGGGWSVVFRLSFCRSSSLTVNKWRWAGLAEGDVLGRRHRRNRYIHPSTALCTQHVSRSGKCL
jgi:hypothetical protein